MMETMTREELKMVNGGALMDGLKMIACVNDRRKFEMGDRVVCSNPKGHGIIWGISYDYQYETWIYTVWFDDGSFVDGIWEYTLRAE